MLVKENEVERRKLELEVQGKQGSIGRFKTQQQATRKNDEFQAFNNEIAHFEAEIRGLEDREMVLMEQAEALQAKAAAMEKEYTKFQLSIQEQISKLEAGAQAAMDRLKDLDTARAKLAADIPEETLSLYERLFSKKGDAAHCSFGARSLRRLPHESPNPDCCVRPNGAGNCAMSKLRSDSAPSHLTVNFCLASTDIIVRPARIDCVGCCKGKVAASDDPGASAGVEHSAV